MSRKNVATGRTTRNLKLPGAGQVSSKPSLNPTPDPTRTPKTFFFSRLVHRSDDTAEKARVRLVQYHMNIAAIKECYEDITCSLDGSAGKQEVSEVFV